MANVKITDLSALSAGDAASTDVFVIVDVNADATKKITVADATTALAAANDFVTYTQLNSNLNTTTANVTAVEARRVANIAGAISSVLTSDLTASRAMVSDGSGKIAVDTGVTATELGYLDATSSIQTQIDTKIATTASASNDFVTYTRLNANVDIVQDNVAAVESRRTANIAGAISSVLTGDLTASRAMVTDGSGKIAILSGVTSTELGYVDATSSIQTQMDTKIATTASASNDFVTYTRLNANIDIVQDNVASASSNAISSGDTVVNTIDPIITFVANGNEAGRFTTDGNLFVGTTGASGYFLDVRGTTNTAALTATGATVSGLTASRALQTDGSKGLESSAVTTTELGYVNGVTSAIQTQFSAAETRRTNNIAGAISSVLTSDLTASRAMVSDGSGKIAVDTGVTATELGYLDATSSIQTQMDTKIATTASASNDFVTYARLNANVDIVQDNVAAVESRRTANIAGAISSVLTSDLTASRAMVSDGSGKIAVLTGVTSTELGYVDATSSIQTQMDAIESRRTANLVSPTFTGEVNMNDDLVVDGNLHVHGDTITANAVNLVVQDQFIALSNGGTKTMDVGIFYNRGTEGNAAVWYDASATRFKLSETKDPFSNTTISETSAANLTVGALTTSALTIGATAITASGTELNYVDGVSSAIQTQIDSKQDSITTSNLMITTGTSNTYNIGATVASINETDVYLDGIYQTKSQYVLANSSHSIQFIISALVSGLTLETVVRT